MNMRKIESLLVWGVVAVPAAVHGCAAPPFWEDNKCVGRSLEPKQRLYPGNHLCGNDYVFGLDSNGIFGAWSKSPSVTQIWFPQTKFIKPTYLEMQNDGNLVAYGQDSAVVWASDTSGKYGARLHLSDGVIKIIHNSKFIWSQDLKELVDSSQDQAFDKKRINCMPQPLHRNGRLKRGDYLCHGRFYFGVDLTGDLSIWRRKPEASWILEKKWSSGTSGETSAVMQEDGNLVVYDADDVALWSSRTDGNNGAKLFFENRLAYINTSSGKTIWSQNNNIPFKKAPLVYDEDDFDPSSVFCITPVESENRMGKGDYLCEGDYYFGVDEAGDLSMWKERYSRYRKIWSARTSGDVRAVKQRDGNLVVYRNSDDAVLWNSNTEIFACAQLTIRDGTAKLLSQSGSVVWTTNHE